MENNSALIVGRFPLSREWGLFFLFCLGKEIAEAAEFAGDCFLFYVVLPKAEDMPAPSAEAARDGAVAGDVFGDFVLPKAAVGFWRAEVRRASVPKAAVHKRGNFGFGKNKVGAAKQRIVAPPAGDSMPPPNSDKGDFGGLIAARPNPRHHFRPLTSAENVGHCQTFFAFALPSLRMISGGMEN